MLKKFLYFGIILLLLISIFSFNSVYADDILMDLNTTNNNTAPEQVDNTTYNSNSAASDENATTNVIPDYEQVATTSTADYEDSTDLSLSNMINIILIVVGVVLVLLGIAIIIKLK